MFPPSTSDVILATAVVLLGAIGTWLLLPQRREFTRPWRVQIIGIALVGLSLLILALFWSPPGPWLTSLFFYAFGLAAVLGGVMMITRRDPIYSALWFASVVLSTAGLFLLAGAQFLAAGTVIVYAGAIVVTFLFVIMLAQSYGRAEYDRMARLPRIATLSGFVLLWGLMYGLLAVRGPTPDLPIPAVQESRLVPISHLSEHFSIHPETPTGQVRDQAIWPTARLPDLMDPQVAAPPPGLPPPHVASLGATILTEHLIALEIVGVLLLIALIGAVLIAAPRPPVRPGTSVPPTSATGPVAGIESEP